MVAANRSYRTLHTLRRREAQEATPVRRYLGPFCLSRLDRPIHKMCRGSYWQKTFWQACDCLCHETSPGEPKS